MNVQKANEPAMMPFATGVGKRMYARRVKGKESVKKSMGGITRRYLYGRVS